MTSRKPSLVPEVSPKTSTPCSVAELKGILRQSLLKNRQEMPEIDRDRATHQIAEMLSQRARDEAWARIAVFLPWRGEPDLRGLWQQWHGQGLSLALPVVVAREAALEMRHWAGDAVYTQDLMGLPVPATGQSLVCDTWIIPCVGVGPGGERLGAGKGFYDRSMAKTVCGDLAAPARPRFIGVSFGQGEISRPFAEPHDQRLDAHLTERGWRRF
jgi:5-formyltetrahydrofolate cyclo-ligase